MDAQAYLMRHGWSGPGNPLNPNRRPGTHGGLGLTRPLLVSRRENKIGIGKQSTKDPTNQWWLRGFEEALRGVGKPAGDEEAREENTLTRNGSQLYKFFVRGEVIPGTLLSNKKKGVVEEGVVEVKEKVSSKDEGKKEKKRKRDLEEDDESRKLRKEKKRSKKQKTGNSESATPTEQDSDSRKARKQEKKEQKSKKDKSTRSDTLASDEVDSTQSTDSKERKRKKKRDKEDGQDTDADKKAEKRKKKKARLSGDDDQSTPKDSASITPILTEEKKKKSNSKDKREKKDKKDKEKKKRKDKAG